MEFLACTLMGWEYQASLFLNLGYQMAQESIGRGALPQGSSGQSSTMTLNGLKSSLIKQ